MNEEQWKKVPDIALITLLTNRNFNGCNKGDSVRIIKIPGLAQFWIERTDKTLFKAWGKDYQWFDYPKKKLTDLIW